VRNFESRSKRCRQKILIFSLWRGNFQGAMHASAVRYVGESPGALSGHAVVRGDEKYSDQVFLVGGVGSSGEPSSAIYQYSISNKSWKKIRCEGESPPGLTGHEIQFFKGQIFVFGGFEFSKDTNPHSKQLTNDMWSYEVAANRWRKLSLIGGDKISPRTGHSTLFDLKTKKMYVFGGITAEGPSNELFWIHLETLEVQKIQPLENTPIPNPRY
jgi:leucine-zipper-like transcriptional regulator 1